MAVLQGKLETTQEILNSFRGNQVLPMKSSNPLLTNPELQKEFMRNKKMQEELLKIIMKQKSLNLDDSQYDEEDRIYNEEWPDIDEYVKSDLADDVNKPSTVIEPPTSNKTDDDKHMAAMELAPSKTKTNKITEFVEEAPEGNEASQEPKEDEMIRIKIIQSLPDAVMLGDGVELILEEDDIHFIDKDTADWLVESGVAEIENL